MGSLIKQAFFIWALFSTQNVEATRIGGLFEPSGSSAFPEEMAPQCAHLGPIVGMAQSRHVSKVQPDLVAHGWSRGPLLKATLEMLFDELDPGRFLILKNEVEGILSRSEEEYEALAEEVFTQSDCTLLDKVYVLFLGAVERSRKILPLAGPQEKLMERIRILTQVRESEFLSSQYEPQWRESEKDLGLAMEEFLARSSLSEVRKGIKDDLESALTAIRRVKRLRGDYGGLSSTQMPEKFVRAFVKGLDAHSSYYDYFEYKDQEVARAGGFSGLGIEVSEGSRGLFVESLIEGGPSEKNGRLKAGDQILGVSEDGTFVSFESVGLSQAIGYLRGPPGTSVDLVVQRDGKRLGVRGERGPVKSKDARLEARAQGDLTATIHLPGFYGDSPSVGAQGAAKDFKDAILDLEARGVRGFVLDLRGNLGGLLYEALEISAALVGGENVLLQESRAKGGEFIHRMREEKQLTQVPIVVLVDEFSASASEIVAGVLKDYGRALIVGSESTFGKGSVQTVFPTGPFSQGFDIFALLPVGGGFKITTSLYFLPSGESVQFQGVKSHIALHKQNSILSERSTPRALKPPQPLKDLRSPGTVFDLASRIEELRLKSRNRYPFRKEIPKTPEAKKAREEAELQEALRILNDLIAG